MLNESQKRCTNPKTVRAARISFLSSDSSVEIGVENKVYHTRSRSTTVFEKTVDSLIITRNQKNNQQLSDSDSDLNKDQEESEIDSDSDLSKEQDEREIESDSDIGRDETQNNTDTVNQHKHDIEQDQSKTDTESNQSKEQEESDRFQDNEPYSLLSDLSEDRTSFHDSNSHCCVCKMPAEGAHICLACDANVHPFCGKGEEEGYGSKIICNLCIKAKEFQELKQRIRNNTQKQADKMIKPTQKRCPPVKVGDSVMIPIPLPDRPKCEFKNIVAVILDIEEDKHVLGCRAGWIRKRLSRGDFTKCKEKFLTREDLPAQVIPMRTAIGNISITGRTQGHFHCNCKKGCQANVSVAK